MPFLFNRTPPGRWTNRANRLSVRIVMKTSIATTIALIGSSSLSSVVVSAINGAPRGF
jgi:hypothetical protein